MNQNTTITIELTPAVIDRAQAVFDKTFTPEMRERYGLTLETMIATAATGAINELAVAHGIIPAPPEMTEEERALTDDVWRKLGGK